MSGSTEQEPARVVLELDRDASQVSDQLSKLGQHRRYLAQPLDDEAIDRLWVVLDERVEADGQGVDFLNGTAHVFDQPREIFLNRGVGVGED